MGSPGREPKLDEITPGTVLDVELRDADGRLLLPAGVMVSAAMLAELRQHGALTPPASAQETEAIDRDLLRIRYIFRGAGDSAPLNELERQITAYRQRKRS